MNVVLGYGGASCFRTSTTHKRSNGRGEVLGGLETLLFTILRK